MKSISYRSIPFLFSLLLLCYSCLPSVGQVLTIKTGSLVEKKIIRGQVQEVQVIDLRGSLQWQQSSDGVNWLNWSGKTEINVLVTTNDILFVRCAIREANCDAVYSDVLKLIPCELATVTTKAVTDIFKRSAVGGGEIVNDGGDSIRQRGVCWSLEQSPTISDSHSVDGVEMGSYPSKITGLIPETVYYVRAYAINFAGTAYGNEVSFATAYNYEEPNHLTLWYNQPANTWEEALPVGNGRLGAMVFGNPMHERIQLNEESIWAGCPVNNNNPGSLEHLPDLQKALFEGRFAEAYQMANDYMLGTPPYIRSYQPLGDLHIDYAWGNQPENYRRSIDLKTGIAATEFTVEGKKYRQEVYASVPDNILVINILALNGGSIDATVSLSREKDATVDATAEGELLLIGQIIDEENPDSGPAGAHMKFAGELRLTQSGGQLTDDGSQLHVNGSREVTLRLTAATDYSLAKLDFDRSIDPPATCDQILDQATNQSGTSLMTRHLAEYQPIFNRVSLELGDSELDSLPTDVRLARMQEGGEDNGLIAMYFQYGRYLLMGSSRGPAILPANLQGIWNQDMNAAWDSDFHTNINLQMNYWPAEVCNLTETTRPLISFLEKLRIPGTITAREMYGTDGWVFHHLVDPFGRTGVADGVWGVTPLNSSWMTFTGYEHFLFTRDTAFLRTRAWPMMKGSAQFVLGFLVESPEGYLVTNPSHSPENWFMIPGSSENFSLTYAATIDIEILNALFDNCIETCRILGTDPGFATKLADAQKRLPPVRVNSNGGIQEWIADYIETYPGHRHMSHLLGLYPLWQFTPETPEFFNAAQASIERRLSFGGGHTGWSRAWIVCLYARLLNGEKAYENLLALLRKSTLNNLFDTHPPFQIDGNFGGTAGIAEMLIQSHNGLIRLLPALPNAWGSGEVKGLCARGGFVLDFAWASGKLTHAYISSKTGGIAKILYAGKEREMTLNAGERLEIKL